MKKFSFVLMAAAVLVAALSCEKENPIENNNPENVNVKTASWSFTANVENPVTKMGDMDSEGNFAWESGDEIKILYAGGSTTATATLEGGIAKFEPSIPGGVTDVWMVYPSSMTASLDGDNLVIGMPGMQKDALSGWFVAKAAVGDASISFMHPVCYFKLIVDGDGNDVTDLELTSSAGADITATSLSLAFDASGIPSATAVSGSASLSATFSGAGTYYIPVLPDVDFASGDLKFQFYRGGSNAEKAGAYKHNAAVTSTRAHIKNWKSLPAQATNRYVSTSASGSANGTTSATPWSLAQLKALMEASDGRDADVRKLFDGINVRFAAGTYTPTARFKTNTNIRLNWIGESAATTIFDGSGSSEILFDVYQTDADGEVITFKNLTFQKYTNASSEGGAFRIGSGSRVFKLHFEDCAFIGNQASASGKSGGVFYVKGASTVSFKNCNFLGNHSLSYGGVMTVASDAALASFEGCSFGDGTSDNRNYAYSGSVFHAANTAAHSFTDCVFDYNQGTGNWGSVIYLTGTSVNSKLLLNRCLFKNNISKNRGIVSANGPRAFYLNAVTFKDNTLTDATSHGSCVHANNQSVVCMNNVTSYNNRCTNGSSTENNYSFNCDGSILMVNSTIVDGTPKYVFRTQTATSKVALCNNIVINTVGSEPFTIHNDAECVNNGHNLISAAAAQGNLPSAETDLFSITDAGLGGSYSEVWNSTDKYGVYSWTNSLVGFTPATQTEVENTIKGYDYDLDGVTNVGNDFYAWLSGIGALGRDARGVSRSGSWWPGAYQN